MEYNARHLSQIGGGVNNCTEAQSISNCYDINCHCDAENSQCYYSTARGTQKYESDSTKRHYATDGHRLQMYDDLLSEQKSCVDTARPLLRRIIGYLTAVMRRW